VVISRQLGHSSAAITNTYINHLNPEEVIETMQRRESAMPLASFISWVPVSALGASAACSSIEGASTTLPRGVPSKPKWLSVSAPYAQTWPARSSTAMAATLCPVATSKSTRGVARSILRRLSEAPTQSASK